MRSSNIELCRIASILLVILLHSASWTQGNVSSIQTCFVPSLFMKGFAVIGVNVFVFISGWFGISIKKKSILNLLYICLFYGFLRLAALYCLGTVELRNYFIISDTTWFVISYFGLLLFSPILNKYVEASSKRLLGLTIVLLFIYQTWFGWFPALPLFDTFQNGYSFVSFIIIYLLAQYLRRYGAPKLLEKYCLLFYFVISICLGLLAFNAIKYRIPIYDFIFKYNNPLVIFSAISFFYTFKQLKIRNSRMINYIASSTLAVLLIHEPQPLHKYIKLSFSYLRDSMGGGKLIMYWILSVLCIYFLCVIIDQIRMISFKMLFRNKV